MESGSVGQNPAPNRMLGIQCICRRERLGISKDPTYWFPTSGVLYLKH